MGVGWQGNNGDGIRGRGIKGMGDRIIKRMGGGGRIIKGIVGGGGRHRSGEMVDAEDGGGLTSTGVTILIFGFIESFIFNFKIVIFHYSGIYPSSFNHVRF